jgi:hypothetical protein
MVKYEVKMKMLREGMVSDMADTGYDPAKDLASHSSNLRVSFLLNFMGSELL